MSVLISLHSRNSAQVSHKGCSATHFCMGLEKQSKLLVSPELWRNQKDASAIISLYCLIITSETPLPCLSLSFRRVHQQPRFDIHTEIEMWKDALLMPRPASLSLPAHFHLHQPFTFPSLAFFFFFAAHRLHSPRCLTS